MRCNKCGKENPEQVNFCKYCGNPMYKNMEDLVERAKQNDQRALEEIYRYSSISVYRVIKVLIKDEDTVNDILQDTYVKAFTRLDQLQNPERLLPWLKMIANNTAKDWLKRSKPVFFSEMSAPETDEELSFEDSLESCDADLNPEMVIDEKEVHRLIMEILDQLPEDQRVVVGMYYYEEMSVRDIALTLGVSDNTVKSRLVYARKKIKEQVLDLEKRGTKLYTAAPFVFFLYLLRRMQNAPTTAREASVLQGTMESGICSGSGRISQNTPESPSRRSSETASGNAGKKASGGGARAAARSAAGTASRTAAKHMGIKIAALVIAGAAGAGGITYGVVKNYDKLPFIQNQETESPEQNENTDTQTEPTEKPAEITTAPETAEEQESAEEATESVDENAIYQTFCENYAKEENLQVISDGFTTQYDINAGYPNDLLLGTYVNDFGGDGKQELLLVRTRSKAKESESSNYADVKRVWYLELYGIDGEEVHARQYLELPDSDLNSYLADITEQIGIKEENGFFEIYRYGKQTPAHGATFYKNTFIKATDTDLQQENDVSYMFGATDGECKVNGTDFYTGNADADIVNIQNALQPYGMEPRQELSVPLIVNFQRIERSGSDHQDTFHVQNESAPQTEETPQEDTQNTANTDDPAAEGLQLIQGEWYTSGGTPYHYKIVFSGNDLKAYQPGATEPDYERTVRDVIKTDYGYYFVIADDYGDYGYHMDAERPESLMLEGEGNPYSEEGFSGTDSLVREK